MLKYDKETTERMTDAHFKAIDTIISNIKLEIETCINGIKQAHSSVVSLPHVNERGTLVTHSCNLAMRLIGEYWVARLNAIEILMGRPFREYTDGKTTADIFKEIRTN